MWARTMTGRPMAFSRCGIAAAVATVICCSSCAKPVGPVAIIGVDGMGWDVALPLIRQGRMPTLEGLMKRGSFGRLSTYTPAKSPVVWTTVVTGKTPAKHGILDFTRRTESGERVLYSNSDRKTKALWNIFTDAGQRSAVIGWWNTFPVEAISGVMVAQVNTLEQLDHRMWIKPGVGERGVVGQVFPEERRQRVFDVLEEVDRELPELLDCIYPDAAPSRSPSDAAKWESCRWSVRADNSVKRIALEIAESDPLPDLILAYFGASDVIGHHFWRYHAPQDFRYPPSKARVEKLGRVLIRTYENVDAMIGELIAALPENTTVFILSDHGMEAKHTDEVFAELSG